MTLSNICVKVSTGHGTQLNDGGRADLLMNQSKFWVIGQAQLLTHHHRILLDPPLKTR